MIETLAERANADGWLVHRGRRINLKFLVGIGGTDYIVAIRDGRISEDGVACVDPSRPYGGGAIALDGAALATAVTSGPISGRRSRRATGTTSSPWSPPASRPSTASCCR